MFPDVAKICASVEVGGCITSTVFAQVVVPLMHVVASGADGVGMPARSALAVLARMRADATPERAAPSDSTAIASDALTIVFSALSVPDFLAAQRVCHRWRDARLRPAAWPVGGVHRELAALFGEDEAAQLRAFPTVINVICARPATCDAPGLVERLVHLLASKNEAVQACSAQVLANVVFTREPADGSAPLAAAGGLIALVQLVASPCEAVLQNAVWALSNVAKDGAEWCARVLSAGALAAILNAQPSGRESVEILVEAVETMCCYGRVTDGARVVDALDARLAISVKSLRVPVLRAMAQALRHFVPARLASLPRIAECLDSHTGDTAMMALNVLSRFAAVRSIDVDAARDLDLLGRLCRLLDRPHTMCLAAFVLSNVAVDGAPTVRFMHEQRVMQRLLSAELDNEHVPWAVANMILCGAPEDAAASAVAVPALCAWIREGRATAASLKSLARLLACGVPSAVVRAAGGFDAARALRASDAVHEVVAFDA